MFCSKCYKRIEDTWSFCPACGSEIDKVGGITTEQLQEFIKVRKDTLDVLKPIIDDLETYGKMQTSTSLIANGARIASGILWLTVPGKSIAVVADLAACSLNVADFGVSMIAAWKESGLLKKADKACKIDFNCYEKNQLWLHKTIACVEVYRGSPLTFNKKIMEWKMSSDQKLHQLQVKTCLSILANMEDFVKQCMVLYKGSFSKAAEKVKEKRRTLQEEYDIITSVDEDKLAELVGNEMQKG